ncbi:glucokinase [Siccirubricoccus deserti]|uniref:ROK family protein n=1 Tax=Siccirubricoccus deserti TaxID=2013562 RepID=A0A9X0QXA0_9PROT|nr:ROK family protein [Siccirubricoccus deserti]MBC4015661.1 ROK family protein [Siccirubricoccus deserti]GGC43532.1 glucokinase [Siccirubricoccus deserti]
MPDQADRPAPPAFSEHGAAALPAVTVDAYNAELKTPDGFLGDRASSRAFRALLEEWRKKLRAVDDEDPLGKAPTDEIGRRQLDRLLADGNPDVAGLVHGVVEEFAQSLAIVVKRLLKLKDWEGTERIVVGGGMRGSRVGELAIGRTAMLLKGEEIAIDLQPIRHDPDEAGMIGAVQLAPPWIFKGHDALLAVDIGGSNIRAGLVRPHLKKAPDLSAACLWDSEIWPHREERPAREAAIDRLGGMLVELVRKAEKRGLTLAPFIGVGCPGRIEADGGIAKGAQNLPGNWESSRFNLPDRLREAVPEIDGQPVVVVMHNDAVVQGLSEVPWMQDVAHWGVLTIGTGLGNARFTNREG